MSASRKGGKKEGKKEVRQEELRRLMKEKQKRSSQEKRVQSPFARYNSHAELSCSLCCVRLRSELLWPAHVLGKQHKEKVAELKGGKESQEGPTPGRRTAEEGGAKGRQGPSQGQLTKRRAPEEEEEVTVKRARGAVQSEPTQKSAGLSLLTGVYDDDDDDDDEDDENDEKGGAAPPSTGLPADFFDSSLPSSISHSGSIQKAEAPPAAAPPGPERSSNTAEALPEGFFDDPVRDAKVRNVEAPQEQMEKEWEEFQKEIRQVNTKSDAIVAEEDEEGRLERQIEEIDQQIECYRRVEVLRDRREEAKSKQPSKQEEEEQQEEQDEDEEELLGLLSRDWRAKGALA